MRVFRLIAPAVYLILITFLATQGNAQAPPPAPGSPSPDTGTSKQGQQNQASPTSGTVVAAPGSTVVVQPSQPSTSANSGGLIVAAPGSTVVVQASPSSAANSGQKASTTNKLNTFSSKDTSTVTALVTVATTNTYKPLVRAGAIDALGTIGASDQTTGDQIAKGLSDVLDMEFVKTMAYADTNGIGSSEFLCLHTVQAIGNLGWYGKCAIPKMQLLRGQNVILDGAIDHAVSAMQNAPAPAAPANNPNNMNTGGGTPGTPAAN